MTETQTLVNPLWSNTGSTEEADHDGNAAINKIKHTESIPRKLESSETKEENNQCATLSEQPQSFAIKAAYEGWPIVARVIERKKLMSKLEGFIITARDFSQRRIAILHGAGGFGKSQLAMQFAQKNSESFTFKLYINASTNETTNQGFSAGLDQIWSSWEDKPATKPTMSEEIVSLVKQWLSLPQNAKWLLLFDNVEQFDRDEYDIRRYIPEENVSGTVLLTTQFGEMYGRFSSVTTQFGEIYGWVSSPCIFFDGTPEYDSENWNGSETGVEHFSIGGMTPEESLQIFRDVGNQGTLNARGTESR